MRTFPFWLIGLVASCGDSPPEDVAGTYTINLTNGANGCNLENWTEGNTSSGIPVVITQADATASAEVMGLAAVALDVALAGHVFTGDVDGDDLNLAITGTRSATSGNCTYTYNALLDATLAGDVLTGTISYQAATNDNSDCAALEGCASVQNFNGTRPPS